MHLTVQQTEELVEKYIDGEKSAYSVAIKDVAINAQGFVTQMQGGADRLRALGYKITCLTESGEAWTRITVTIVE